MTNNINNVDSQTKKTVVKDKTKLSQLSTKNRASILSELKRLKVQVNSCIALISQNKIDASSLGSIKSLSSQIISAETKVSNVSEKIKKSLITKTSSIDDKVT